MNRRSPSLHPLLPFLFVAVAVPPLAAVETVSPGELAAASAPAPPCPTFHWTADASAAGFELAVAAVEGGAGGDETYHRLWSVELPAGATGWTAAGGHCLEAGRSYYWSLRPIGNEEAADGDREAAPWAEARRFEVPEAVSDDELAEAIAVVRRYLASGGELAETPAAGAKPASRRPGVRLQATLVPETAPTGSAAISGSYPGAVGETYGVLGRSDSSSGRGVVGYASSLTGSTYGVYGEVESLTGIGVYGQTSATSGSSYGVEGRSYSSAGRGVRGLASALSGFTVAVEGWADSPNGTGVRGVDGSTLGTTTGVEGRVYSIDGRGVYGWATTTTGTTFGVYGESDSSDGRGVYGTVPAVSGTTFGVYGSSDSTTAARGVYGLATSTAGQAIGVLGGTNGTTSSAYGVYGIAPAGSAAYAAYFQGGVAVIGNLSKSSGSFQIDHPLDPENKYLFHSFVESPDMMNVYNGNVTLDAEGTAWVELPDWFEALNRDFRYQLTPLGDWSACWIAHEVEGNRFEIQGGPHARISWQVTGIRKDPWAERHRIEVEVEKPANERGTYLHAREWGVAPERGLDWEMRAEVGHELESQAGRAGQSREE